MPNNVHKFSLMKITKNIIISSAVVVIIMVIAAFAVPVINDDEDFIVNYSVLNTWIMPESLDEISGIAWMGNNKLACVQDEEGIIFIYDLNQKKIVENILFEGAGDYEAIAVNGSNAYVMRSDGTLFEIRNFRNKAKEVSKFESEFSSKNNIESLVFDHNLNSLLTIPKHVDLDNKDSKNVYSISLKDEKIKLKSLFKIDMEDKKLKDFKHKKSRKNLMPSDIAIHPKTGEVYILEGKDSKLLILDKKGNINKVYPLDKKVFRQPEGITFSDNGDLYISNERHGEAANILEVKLNE